MGTRIDINELYAMIMAAFGESSTILMEDVAAAMDAGQVKPIELPEGQRWWKHEVEQWLDNFRAARDRLKAGKS